MSKRRGVVLSITVEGLSQAQAARLYGVSESFVSRLMARYRAEGEAAFEPRSTRPLSSPSATDPTVCELVTNLRQELVTRGLDAGPATIAWHLHAHHGIDVSVSTIRRRLVAAGLVIAEPKKRPRSSYVRFEAALPNECWQSDFTHWRLDGGTGIEILTWLDDHSRYCLSLTVHKTVTGPAVVETFVEAASRNGFPASVLTDNAMVYTTRFSGGRGGRNQLETVLRALGVVQKHSRPNHPTTCGKVERFQQTLKRWLSARPSALDLDQLQSQLDEFAELYNHHRPHVSLRRRPPAVVYGLLPKDTPTGSDVGPHYRVRTDRVYKTGTVSLRRAGRMHHISIGRGHAGKAVMLLIAELDIRVVDFSTGELLRQLTLDPNRGYQPRFKRIEEPDA